MTERMTSPNRVREAIENFTLAERARIFALAAHAAVGQKRKYTGEPYIEHPRRVVELLTINVGVSNETQAAAWLHDVVEDTDCTIEDIAREFGETVSSYVSYLTDVQTPEDGKRVTRKTRAAERLAQAPAMVQTIKYADLIDNGHSIVSYDEKFAKVFLIEMRQLLEMLDRGAITLRSEAWRLWQEWDEKINQPVEETQ